MSIQFRRVVFVASTALIAAAVVGRAELPSRTPAPDSRWDAWLGCWAVDTAGTGQSARGITCVVPIAGSRAVEALTFARGKVVARDRLDSGGEPHAVSGQGCRGFETMDWSVSGRRALLRSDYVCGSTKGSSSTIYAIAPGGDWLRVEQVRSGNGVTESVERRRPIPVVPEVSADAARAIEDRRMAIATARAAAAAPITTDEIVEAIHAVDPSVVRTWIVASGQSFALDGASLAWLVRADVPQSVLQVMMADEAPLPAPALERVSSYYGGAPAQIYTGPTAYASATANPPEMQTMYPCQYDGCNAVPNPYSILNGYGVYPYGYAAPFTPFTSTFPGGFLINRFTGNGRVVGRRPVNHKQDGHPFVHTGKGPMTGGGRRR